MTCRIITVDGTPVRLQGDGSMTAEDAAAFIELVRAVRALPPKPGRHARQAAARERYRRRLIRNRTEEGAGS